MKRPIQYCFALLTLAAAALPAAAHETDQFTIPPSREFADYGPYFNSWVYAAIERGVEKTNSKIKMASERRFWDVEQMQSPDEIARSVNSQFPSALFLIEGLDKMALSPQTREQYPGRITGYKPDRGVRKYVELPLNPFNAWGCATIKVYDVYLGTDKLGHFVDMGIHYFRAYRMAIRDGRSEEEAIRRALHLGTHDPIMSERGLLGLGTAGAYSNADLVANYMGMVFYRSLTEPVMLKGQLRPPMLERDGDYWKIAPHIRRDNDFFSLFISDHLNEAFNPSLYLTRFRPGIRKAIRENRAELMERYTDRHGNRLSAEEFRRKAHFLATYYGFDYGHEGNDEQLIMLSAIGFDDLPHDADPKQRDFNGMTSLHHAARRGDLAMIRALLSRGADVNEPVRSKERHSSEWGNTPLHYAAREGKAEAMLLLIERGAEVNATNDLGVTPLHRAIKHSEVAELLIEHGAKVTTADARGRTPLHWAAYDPDAPTVLLLLANGADPNARDKEGETPLHRATRAGNATAAADLLADGADVNAPDRFNATPLHIAAHGNVLEAAELLLARGAKVDARDDLGCTPLHLAARERFQRMTALLLNHDASPQVADVYGATPLHLASRRGDQAIARLLLDHGADVRLRTAAGRSAIDEARRAKHDEIARMLQAQARVATTAAR